MARTRSRRRGAANRERPVTLTRDAGPDRRRILAGVAVLGGGALLAGAMLSGFGGPAAAGPRPTAAPSAQTSRAALPAGSYSSHTFEPAVTFTLPEGWWIPSDMADYLSLQPIASDVTGIYLFRDPSAASQEAACPQLPAAGVGKASYDLLDWISRLPGLSVSNRRLTSIAGLPGSEVDISIAAGWTTSCPFANGLPTVPLFVGRDGTYRWVIAGSERLRLTLVDLPAGGTVAIDIDAFDGAFMDDLVARATPIAQSIRINATAPGASSGTPAP